MELFPSGLGTLSITPGAQAVFANAPPCELASLVERHRRGDWGDVSYDDKLANDEDAKIGGRVLSAYEVGGKKVWIITDAGHQSSCVLLPEEY